MRVIVRESQAARTDLVCVRVGSGSVVLRAIAGGVELGICDGAGVVLARESYTGREAVVIADRIGAIVDGE